MQNKSPLIPSNFHTHTALCNHASGEIRDYVTSAVKAGMKTLGFSCHAPYTFDGDFISWFRMRPHETEAYAREILSLKEEFAGKIDVKLGYEAEYYPCHFKDLLDRINGFPCDYIILGQHFINNEYDGSYCGALRGADELKQYVSQVSEAMNLGVYTYVAHPDLPRVTESMDEYLEIMSGLCKASLDTDTPLEINLLGIQEGRQYPKEEFWRMVGEYGCPVVIGYDAHTPSSLSDESSPRRALEMVEKYSLNYTGNDISLKVPVL